jgi:hypothetical protein
VCRSVPLEASSQFDQARSHVVIRVGRKELDRHLASARVQVLAEPGGDGGRGALRDDGVGQPIAAGTGQIVVGEAEAVMPLATCSVDVCDKICSTFARLAGGPPSQSRRKPASSTAAARYGGRLSDSH